MSHIFLANVDRILAPDPDTPATGELARKVCELSPRFAWMGTEGHDVIVLPEAPEDTFLEYVASLLGYTPRVFVPAGLDVQALNILDGFADPELQRLVRGATVQAYASTPAMYHAVTQYGGQLAGGDPSAGWLAANDKAWYRRLATGVIDCPEGVAITGIEAIARAVIARLNMGDDVFVRHTLSGGGFGNRQFRRAGWQNPSLEDIIAQLEGGHPDLWHGATALVEEFLEVLHTFGVTFDTTTSQLVYDFLQISANTDSIGRWSPVPEGICRPGKLAAIGTKLAASLRAAEFRGSAGTDLGMTADGRLIGFEVNGRQDAGRCGIRLTEWLTSAPWVEWRDRGIVTKAIDHFVLARPMNFTELYDAIGRAGILATREYPAGVVIAMPPAGNVAGVLVIGTDGSYQQVEGVYQRLLRTVGDPDLNHEDRLLT